MNHPRLLVLKQTEKSEVHKVLWSAVTQWSSARLEINAVSMERYCVFVTEYDTISYAMNDFIPGNVPK